MKTSKALGSLGLGAILAAGLLGCQKPSGPEGQGTAPAQPAPAALTPATTGQATTPPAPTQPPKP